MRAEDAIEHMGKLDAAVVGLTVLDAMLREGIAYDEVDRFMCLGGFRAEQGFIEGPEPDEPGAELYLHGRLWLDGFLVGRRMMRAEMLRVIDERVREAAAAILDEMIRAAVDEDADDRPAS